MLDLVLAVIGLLMVISGIVLMIREGCDAGDPMATRSGCWKMFWTITLCLAGLVLFAWKTVSIIHNHL